MESNPEPIERAYSAMVEPTLMGYRPNNLIIVPTMPELVDPKPSGSECQQHLDVMKYLLEFQVHRTSIKAVENSARLLDNDVQENYSQDFVFVERKNKAIYNFFRMWRARYQVFYPFEILLIEPNGNMLQSVDAWKMRKVKVDQVRCDFVPRRDLTKAAPEGVHYTTVSLVGELHHEYGLIKEADKVMSAISHCNVDSAEPVTFVIVEVPKAQ